MARSWLFLTLYSPNFLRLRVDTGVATRPALAGR